MKTQTTKPTEGRFIAYWEFRGRIWSDTLRFNDGILERFVAAGWYDGEECWIPEETNYHKDIIFTYVVSGDQ